MQKPFWKASRNRWYVEIKGKQHNLGADKDEAFKEYHRIMAGEQIVDAKTTVEVLLDQFLLWTKQNRSEDTYAWYLKYLQEFAGYIGPRLTVGKIKGFQVTKWIDHRFPNASDNTRNGAGRAVSRAFNWAKKQGLIESNPISGFERPAYQPREDCLTEDQWKKVIGAIPEDDALHDLVWFLHETGARPFEARVVEARHWDKPNGRLVLERRKSKGGKNRMKNQRVIRLNDRATEIIAKLALKHPEGPLFLNNKQRPWRRHSLDSRFCTLREKLGFPLFPYILRHTFCTNALLSGVDPLTVAILMGHKDATMVMKVYSHLVQNDDHLRAKLSQATGEIKRA